MLIHRQFVKKKRSVLFFFLVLFGFFFLRESQLYNDGSILTAQFLTHVIIVEKTRENKLSASTIFVHSHQLLSQINSMGMSCCPVPKTMKIVYYEKAVENRRRLHCW